MTAQEQAKLNSLCKSFEDWKRESKSQHIVFQRFIVKDKEWKSRLESQIEPILQERHDQLVLIENRSKIFHAIIGFIAVLSSTGLFVHYVVQPLLDWFAHH